MARLCRAHLAWLVERMADPMELVRTLLETPEDGRIKLYISHRLLCLRRERPELFVGASYTPLRGNQHVAAFSRGADGQTLVIAAPVQLATVTRGATVPPIGPEVWRVLAKCHEIRNLGEYEGDVDVDERIVADLITACNAVPTKLAALPPLT